MAARYTCGSSRGTLHKLPAPNFSFLARFFFSPLKKKMMLVGSPSVALCTSRNCQYNSAFSSWRSGLEKCISSSKHTPLAQLPLSFKCPGLGMCAGFFFFFSSLNISPPPFTPKHHGLSRTTIPCTCIWIQICTSALDNYNNPTPTPPLYYHLNWWEVHANGKTNYL